MFIVITNNVYKANCSCLATLLSTTPDRIVDLEQYSLCSFEKFGFHSLVEQEKHSTSAISKKKCFTKCYLLHNLHLIQNYTLIKQGEGWVIVCENTCEKRKKKKRAKTCLMPQLNGFNINIVEYHLTLLCECLRQSNFVQHHRNDDKQQLYKRLSTITHAHFNVLILT